ncbi:hypothetical protein, partial [Reichenbachiella sp. MALMAid0571]|uniref:hypothetical protein n=1 Tax=Reichenbachiella sp. MALMAid0571 TaxID=3143939 RepID=UPI0032DFB3C7
DDPSTTSRVVTITSISDNGGTGGSDDDTNDALSLVSTVSITATNDEPTLISTGSNPTFTEGGTAVGLYTGTSASTIESGQAVTGFEITITNVADGSTPGQDEVLNADGSVITLENTNSGTSATNTLGYSVSLSGGTATVTFTGGSMSEL